MRTDHGCTKHAGRVQRPENKPADRKEDKPADKPQDPVKNGESSRGMHARMHKICLGLER